MREIKPNTGDRAVGEGRILGRSKGSSILELLDLEKQQEFQERVPEKQIKTTCPERKKRFWI